MARKRKVPLPDGRVVDATEIPVRSASEVFNEYLLDDGAVVKIKLVVTDVVRLDDQYDQLGNPMYLLQSQNVMTVSAPESLRRDVGGTP